MFKESLTDKTMSKTQLCWFKCLRWGEIVEDQLLQVKLMKILKMLSSLSLMIIIRPLTDKSSEVINVSWNF